MRAIALAFEAYMTTVMVTFAVALLIKTLTRVVAKRSGSAAPRSSS